jgi:glycosyltransferase involved in cell wall biosynthesis
VLKFSIVTPSFQQAAFIERTIQSVIGQNWPLTEHIVIDGGSTDGTQAILERHGSRIAYWESMPDRGQSHAVNKGVARATGDIVGWINSDDVYLPGAFSAVAEVFDSRPELDACYGGMICIDANDRVIDAYWPPRPDVRITVAIGLNVYGQALFVRRGTWEKLGGIDESFHMAMDYDFITRLLLECRVARIERYLGALRMHAATKTGRAKADSNGVSRREIDRLRQRYARRAGVEGLRKAGLLALRTRGVAGQVVDAGVRYLAFKVALRAGVPLPGLVGLPAALGGAGE